MPDNSSHNFELEMDVDGLHPASVDPVTFLQYAAAYLEGLQLVARLSDGELTFTGLQVVDKCIAVRSRVNNPDLSWSSVSQLDNLVAGTVRAPRKYGLVSHTKNLVSARERFVQTLPKTKRRDVKTIVRVTDRVQELRPPAAPEPEAFRYRTIETLRAKVERLAGSSDLKARLVPILGVPFVVDLADEAMARDVRHYWLDEVDVDVEVERALGGNIVKGRLLKFHGLEDGPGVHAWRRWAEENEPELSPEELGDV